MANSDAMVARLVSLSQERYSSINYGGSKCIYVVGPDVEHKPVTLINQADEAMHAMLAAGLPIPDEAKPNPHNTDKSLCIYQPSTDLYAELWLFNRDPTTGEMSCHNAGCTTQFDVSPGFFNPTDWTDGKLTSNFGWGHRATSLLIAYSAITRSQFKFAMDSESILPLALPLMGPHAKSGKFCYPAQRCDGDNTAADAIPEGARILLDSGVDASQFSNPAMRVLVRTAQTRGMVYVDQSPYLGWDTMDIYDLTEAPDAVQPPLWSQMLGLNTHNLVKNFPWPHTYVVHSDLRSKAGW